MGVLLLVFALYILSDPQTLKYVVDRATTKLDVSYDAISGNFLKTMSIKNLRYKGNLLAKEAEIDWNLRALIKGDIEIETLSLKNVNLANIQSLIKKAQHAPSKKDSRKKSSSIDFPQVSISHLFLSTLPYKTDIITIETFELELYDITSDLKELSIKEFSLDSHNNHSNIQVSGEIKQRVLHLKKLALDQINIAQIMHSITLMEKKEKNKTSQPFTMIEDIIVDNLSANIKPYTYTPYKIDTLVLKAKDIHASLPKKLFSANDIFVESKTNLGILDLQANLDKNFLKGESLLKLSQKYLQRFTKIVDFKSLNPIKLSFLANPKTIDANITLKSKQVFAGRYKHYLSAINNLKSQLNVDIKRKKLTLLTDANISSKYASSLLVKDSLIYDGNLSYGGTIAISKLQHVPKFSLPLFKHAIIHYKANSKDLVAHLQTDKLHLVYEMFGYKRAAFTLSTKKLDIVNYFPDIPQELHPLNASLNAHMALDFNNARTIIIDNNITSNALNIIGQTTIKSGKILTKTKTSLSKNSFLPKIDKKIKFNNIFPIDLNIGYHDKYLSLTILGKKELVKNNFSYDFNSSLIDNKLTIGADTLTLKGESKNLKLHIHTFSLKSLQESLHPLYSFEKKPYDGEIEINATIENMARFDADIYSHWLVYEYKPYKYAFAEKIKTGLLLTKEYALIKHYRFNTYLDYDRVFYASKPSKITFKDKQIELLSLWVNDALNTTGDYDITRGRGTFHSTANNYHYKGREGDILFSTNINTSITKTKTHIEGDVNLLKGLITYEHRKTHEISDPDIIIIQEEAEAKARAAEKKSNLSIDVSIHSKKPLTYKIPQIEVNITPDIKVWKESQKELELLGRVIVDGGRYTQGEKEFIIQQGEVLFGGKILNPYLNLKAQYTNKPYIIDIFVTGTLDSPIVNFSSSPYLSQSDILSMLLFSATTESLFEGSASSSNQALSMLGNTFAKEIVKNFGLTLDKLVLSTNEQGGLGIEIGKKISKKITVIYTNDLVQSIKVKYQNSNSFETDLMISPESSGIDFLYKSEH